MNKSLDTTVFKKGDETQVCTNCDGNKCYSVSESSLKCFNCEHEFKSTLKGSPDTSPQNRTFKLNEISVRKTYSLRKDKQKFNNLVAKSKIESKQEPELIEILSSEEEETEFNNCKQQSIYLNTSKNSNKKNTDLKINTTNGAKYVFREWDIKESDIESFDKLTHGKYIDVKPENNEKIIEKKVKNFRLGNFVSDTSSTLQLSPEGLEFKLTIKDNEEDDFLVSITVCLQDIVYCALVFHYPVYVLLFRIHDTTSNLYYNQLKELRSFEASHIDQTNKSRIAAVLDISRSELSETCFQFYSFFKQIPVSSDYPTRTNFIKLAKSKQLIYNVFRNDKNLDDIVNFTKECLADDLAKPILKYPNGDDAVVISYSDLSCLNDTIFLNDNIISFYLKYLQYEILTEHDRRRTHIFDTFFYQCLTTKSLKKNKDDTLTPAERRHARVKNWTRNVNLFEKDFLIVPINKSSHWYLVIICYPYLSEPIYDETLEKMDKSDEDSNEAYKLEENRTEKSTTEITTRNVNDYEMSADEADEDDSNLSAIYPNNKENNKICTKMPIILVFDSLLSVKKTRVIATLREYLQCEWKAKFGTLDKKQPLLDKLAGTAVKVPIQTNFFDCGIYLLQYVEQFFKDPINDFTIPIKLDKWFTTETINKKRQEIKNIIIKKSHEKNLRKMFTNEPAINNKQTDQEVKQTKQNGTTIKKPNTNGTHLDSKEEDESKTKIKKFKNESHLDNDSSKLPEIINTTRSFYNSDRKESKSKYILDDMDNLI